MRESAVTIECAGEQLLGVLHEPSNAATAGILIVVGGPQYRAGSHRQFVQMARIFQRHGFAVLRFDCRGMGDSTGNHPGFESLDLDIAAAHALLLKEVPSIKRVLGLGLCDAATALLLYCSSHDGLDGLVLINPWVRTESGHASANLHHYYTARILHGDFWRKILSGQIDLAASVRGLLENFWRALKPRLRPVTTSREPFLRRMESGARRFAGSTLFLLSESDITAREFDAECRRSDTWRRVLARPTVRTLSVARADHTFSSAVSLRRACDEIVAWTEATCLDRARPV